MEAAYQAIQLLFEKNVVKKITVVKIPKKRDYMHIDTVFTQIRKDAWVMLGVFSKKSMKHENEDAIQRALEGSKKDEKLKIIQCRKKDIEKPVYVDNIEDLLVDISKEDLQCHN